MMKRVLLPAIALAFVLVLVATIDAQRVRPSTPQKRAPAAAAPRIEAPVPFSVGETLTYDVSWSGTVSAGTATLRVVEKKPSYDSMAYYIVAEAQPASMLSRLYSLYYKADTLLDAYSLLPQRGSLFSREGKRQRMKITEFNHGSRKARFEMRTASTMAKDLSMPPDTQDMLSAIYALRASPATTGDRLSVAVADTGRLYNVEFAVGPREMVKRGNSNVPALRVTPTITDDQGQPVGRDAQLWISDDARRVPVRLEAQLAVGRFVLAVR